MHKVPCFFCCFSQTHSLKRTSWHHTVHSFSLTHGWASLALSLSLFLPTSVHKKETKTPVSDDATRHTHTPIEVALRKRERDADSEPAVILPPLRATICLQQLCIHTQKNWPPPLFSKHIQTHTHTERHLCTQKHHPVPRECLGHAGALQHAAIPLLGRGEATRKQR